MLSRKLKKIHNFDELEPYINSYEQLSEFMKDVEVHKDVAFDDDKWTIERGKVIYFRFEKENDILALKSMKR